MRNKADAVIIGGGIIGLAVAFYLAKEKLGQVILLEKEKLLGTGATSKAAGGIRAQFSTEDNIRMSMLSEKLFVNFKEDTGHDALFDQVGYLFVVKDDQDAKSFREQVELQRALGLNVEILQPEDIPRVAPHVNLDGVQFATFCQDDGLGDPHEFLSGYDHAARQLGVEIAFEAEARAIEVNGSKVTKVVTSKGDITTPLVVNCAGPYGNEIAKMVGSDLKIQPIKRQIVTTGELSFVKPFFPMAVDVRSGLYTHKESKGMLLGWAKKDQQPGFDISIDPDYTDQILEMALDFIPQLEEAEVANQWAGLYESTPDHREVIGWDPSVEGMFHTTGFSGHGFMHAPGAGLITAEMVAGREPSIDVSSYSPQRFVEGTLVEETNVI